VRGGYRQEGATELWLIPPKAENPEPSKTISDKLPPEGFSETTAFLYAERRNVISSHEDDFMLDSIREERAAERRDDDEPTIIPGSERDISDDDSNETDAERIKREEESRFRWVDLGIAERMANRKGSIGVIFFYADDKRFDIRKLQSFVEMGRDVLARHRPVVKNRFEIRYGGYREDPEVAFWFVPANAVAPMPQPFERCR
jgi:hypothetical protein